MEPSGSGATWTKGRRLSLGAGESTRVARSGSAEIISKWSAQRSAVRSIAWLDLFGVTSVFFRVLGQLAMRTVALEKDAKTQAPHKSFAAARTSKKGDL